MSAVLVLTALLLAAAPPARENPAGPSCDTYTLASVNAPPMVHSWLSHSSDEHVRVCQLSGSATSAASAASYTGESAVRHHGGVCSYSSHRLEKIGDANRGRLERYERSDVQVMALAGSECPTPHPTGADAYIPTYDVSARAFEAIMQLWAAASASTQRFDQEVACCADSGPGAAVAVGPAALGDSGRRLRSAINAGHMKSASVTRIVRMSGSVWQHRYALFVANPDIRDAQPRLYVIYLRKPLRGPFHITSVADTN